MIEAANEMYDSFKQFVISDSNKNLREPDGNYKIGSF
jgi:hypothetical protein